MAGHGHAMPPAKPKRGVGPEPPGSTWYGAAKAPVKLDYQAEQAAHLRAIAFSLLLCLVLTGVGYDFGVMNGALLRIVAEYPTTTLGEASLASAHALGTAVGSMLGGEAVDLLGRRPAMTITAWLLALVPIAMAFATSVTQLVLLRAIIGLCIGSSYIVVVAYTAELSPVHLRGALTTLHEVALNVGQLLGYLAAHHLLGVVHDWRWMLAGGAVIPLVTVLAIHLLGAPESPRWLVMKGQTDRADAILVRYLGVREGREAWDSMVRQGDGQEQGAARWEDVLGALRHPGRRKMMLACVVVGLAEPCCGANGLLAYSSTIFEETMSESEAFSMSILMGVAKLVASLFAMVVIENIGRRPLLVISSFLTLMCNLMLAIAYQCAWHSHMQVTLVCIFMVAFELGICPLAFTYCSEVLCTQLRAKGMAATFCLARCIGFANLVYLPAVLSKNCSSIFYLQSGLNLLSLIGLFLYVPETKGKTLEDMHEIFDETQ